MEGTKNRIYFASDFHLGIDSKVEGKAREKKIVEWLDSISSTCKALYLVGDIFDFWYEYNYVIPKGYVRFLGQLAKMIDQGIEVVIFTGNHDMWMFDYLEDEIGVKIYRKPQQITLQNKEIFIGHGDGLGPGDKSYKLLKKVFQFPVSQWLFNRIHPNLGFGIAHYWSKKSRERNKDETVFLGPDKEWLIHYCERKIKAGIAPDYFVFGHRHIPIYYQLSNQKSIYINLGEWFDKCSYAYLEAGQMHFQFYKNPDEKPVTNMDQTAIMK